MLLKRNVERDAKKSYKMLTSKIVAGVLAANSKYRSIVTQCANQEFKPTKISNLIDINRAAINFKVKTDALWQRKKSSVSWAKLIMKVYEEDPLKCEQYGEPMKIIAYIPMQQASIKYSQILAKTVSPPKRFEPKNRVKLPIEFGEDGSMM